MNNRVNDVLENACRLTRIPVGEIRSEREANEVIAWANAVLQLAYAAGEFELSCDATNLKKSGLELRHSAQLYLKHKTYSDIVATCNTVVRELDVACKAICPEFSLYLKARVDLGTY